MKMHLLRAFTGVLLIFSAGVAHAGAGFSIADYAGFLQANKDLSAGTFLARHTPAVPYFKDTAGESLAGYAYLDSVMLKIGLTAPEKDLLARNRFVVTERLNYACFGRAFHSVYNLDLPVFVSTDAVLQALHASYDRILQHIELAILEPNLGKFLDALDASYPVLLERYRANPKMAAALGDVDLHVTMARSLLADRELTPRYIGTTAVDAMWNAVRAEKLAYMPLFSDRARKLDFSQFIVRGHYTDQTIRKPLGPYFHAMMWLGRMDFLLTPPPASDEPPWTREELRRMNLGAALLSELIDLSGARVLMDENDGIIDFMVGESDNLTPGDLAGVLAARSIGRADGLLDDAAYDAYLASLVKSPGAEQRILSDFFIVDPFSEKPDPLPVSFRLMGQRFIIDSYIFSNVVYDRIVFEGRKIWRPMPNPLDVLFVLGNDDALPILEKELAAYTYSSQMASLRYLVDAYDDGFWNQSLYNAWLGAIRALNPPLSRTGLPFFMQTAAWRQEKMNTQLASWSHLRHDTLLYAKQSYTGGTACSYPRSFVEPVPECYRRIGLFAERAEEFFSKYSSNDWVIRNIKDYFPRLKTVMSRLETIAGKELAREPISSDEADFLGKMLFTTSGSGAPPFSGWYADLFYDVNDAAKTDYTIADVHTQPTDEAGSVVGRVLHVGVGKVNLGVFLAGCPSDGFEPTAFVGPVMSYYEKTTDNFDRLTDERWLDLLTSGGAPVRPDWVNIYLADAKGNALGKGRELPGVSSLGTSGDEDERPSGDSPLSAAPNPFNPTVSIRYRAASPGHVRVTVYDILGGKVAVLADAHRRAGEHAVVWNARNMASGVYFCRLEAGGRSWTIKMTLLR